MFTSDTRPIGIFDSGVGGLTVTRAIANLLPYENLIYFGDTLHFPYGEKSEKTIIQYGLDIVSFLNTFHIKILVIACNTACAHSLKEISSKVSFPVIGVIEPGLKRAIELSKSKHFAVLGTRGTIRSSAYQKAVHEMNSLVRIHPLECPLLAPLVEENFIGHPATRLIVQTYLDPLKNVGVDLVLLGCTHYPLLKSHFAEVLGDQVLIIDSAISLAEELSLQLKQLNIENRNPEPGKKMFFVSEDPQKFQKIGRFFFKDSIPETLEANIFSQRPESLPSFESLQRV